MKNVLKKIIDKKKEKIKIYKNEHSESKLFNDIKNINISSILKIKLKKETWKIKFLL